MVEASSTTDLNLITAAATSSGQRPAAQTVVEALLQVEKAAKQQRVMYPPEALIGQWQLRFATGVRKAKRGGITLGKGFYMPSFVQAQIGFEWAVPADSHPLTISNQLQLGALRFQIFGPAKYLHKKNLLSFDFTQMDLILLGRSLYRGNFRGGQTEAAAFDQKPVAKLPFFSFFLITEELIAARGRGGGLAIWSK
jgi:hypothetical protein